MNAKFTDQGRYSMGVCMVPYQDDKGIEINKGIRLDPYFYSGKNIITLSTYNTKLETTSKLIRCMPDAEAKAKGWIGVTKRDKKSKEVYMQDTLDLIPGIAAVIQAKMEKNGISLVQELASLDDIMLHSISSITRISTKRLITFRSRARQAKQGASMYPQKYDFRYETNPFLTRYGSEWEKYFISNKMSGMRGKVCVTHLVQHIDKTTKAAYKGTKYETTYLWSHDALTQMFDQTCIEWMKKERYYERWLKPEMGISEEVFWEKEGVLDISRRYNGRPVGNSPELMPLDNSLFRDFRASLNLHIGLTAHLPDTDVRKFCKSTPNRLDKAVRKIWHPETGISPRPNRIVQDISRITSACMQIVKFGGGEVPGLAEHNGHRRSKAGTENDRRCRPDAVRKQESRHEKKSLKDLNLLPEAQSVVKEILKNELKKLSQTGRFGDRSKKD